MQRVCVYAGSNKGIREEYQVAAHALGRELVRRNLGLVYGAAQVGLMGVIADSVLAAGGEAIGVMPRALFRREVAHPRLSKLYETSSMHERKAMMAQLADGFIALPGGFGTLDELFEIITWAQIGIHHKPIGLLNVMGFFDPLLALVQHTAAEGFVSSIHTGLLVHSDDAATLLDKLTDYAPPVSHEKWTELPPEP